MKLRRGNKGNWWDRKGHKRGQWRDTEGACSECNTSWHGKAPCNPGGWNKARHWVPELSFPSAFAPLKVYLLLVSSDQVFCRCVPSVPMSSLYRTQPWSQNYKSPPVPWVNTEFTHSKSLLSCFLITRNQKQNREDLKVEIGRVHRQGEPTAFPVRLGLVSHNSVWHTTFQNLPRNAVTKTAGWRAKSVTGF